MKRRHWPAAATTMLASAARGQPRPRRVSIGWVASVPIRRWPPYPAFVEAMRELGWVEGTHYTVDEASYDGQAARIPQVVAELVARKPDLIVGSGTPSMRPLIAATSTIPIVMFAVGDPVGQGFVASLARPGGNVTGTSSQDHGLLGKQFELLLQVAPRAQRIGVVFNPDIPPHVNGLRDIEAAAKRMGRHVRPVALRVPAEFDAVIEALRRESVDAVQVLPQGFLNTGPHMERLAALAIQQRWPTVYVDLAQVKAGILVSYGNRIEDPLRRLPYYIDRILNGAPPGELPVEQVSRFHVHVNLKTARALGITVPQSVLLQASEVIE